MLQMKSKMRINMTMNKDEECSKALEQRKNARKSWARNAAGKLRQVLCAPGKLVSSSSC